MTAGTRISCALFCAAIFAQDALASEIFGPSMAGASNTIGNPDSGLIIVALDNSTLTSFVFTNQGNADTVELTTPDVGSVLDSASVPSGTNPFTASVSWSLTSGDTYWLVSVDRSNGTFISSGTPGASYPQSDSDISVVESEFGGTAIGVGNLQWPGFTDIITSSSAIPEPATSGTLGAGLVYFAWLLRRRKRT